VDIVLKLESFDELRVDCFFTGETLRIGDLRIGDLRIGDLRLRIGDLRLRIGDLRLRIGDLRLRIGDLRVRDLLRDLFLPVASYFAASVL
jgi:hypothetical protein